MQIKEEEIKSVIGILSKMFPNIPRENVEDAVSDKLLMMLEKDYTMTSGNLFALSKFALFKEVKRVDKLSTYNAEYAEVKAEKDVDRYLVLKDGTVEKIMGYIQTHTSVSERDLRIFTEAVLNRTPVHEIAENENLAVSPTYRIIKRVKKKVQKVADIITEN